MYGWLIHTARPDELSPFISSLPSSSNSKRSLACGVITLGRLTKLQFDYSDQELNYNLDINKISSPIRSNVACEDSAIKLAISSSLLPSTTDKKINVKTWTLKSPPTGHIRKCNNAAQLPSYQLPVNYLTNSRTHQPNPSHWYITIKL